MSDVTIYKELSLVPHWRRMFSSLWKEDPFYLWNLTFLSHEHAYQASKYLVNGLDSFGYQYALESDSDVSKCDPVKINKRLYNLNQSQLKIFEDQRDNVKDQIYAAKFTRTSRPGIALMLTHQAQLINGGPRIKKIRCHRLEKQRSLLVE